MQPSDDGECLSSRTVIVNEYPELCSPQLRNLHSLLRLPPLMQDGFWQVTESSDCVLAVVKSPPQLTNSDWRSDEEFNVKV